MMTMTKKLFLLGFLICLFTAGQVFATARHVVGPGAGFGEYVTIQAALNDCIDGDTVHIDDGVYAETCVASDNDLLILGQSSAGVQLITGTYQTGTGFDLSGTDGIIISGMTIMAYATGFGGTGVTNLTADDIVFDDNLMAMSMNVNDGVFTNLTASAGISIFTNGTFTTANNNMFTDCVAGGSVVFDNTLGTAMDMNSFDGGEAMGFGFIGVSTNSVVNGVTVGTGGISVASGTGFAITGNTVGEGISVTGSGDISGNAVSGSTANGIDVTGTCTVDLNEVSGSAGDGIMVVGALSVTNNTVDGSTGDGIDVDGGGMVTGNIVSNSGGNGINLGTGTGYDVSGNDIDVSVGAGILLRAGVSGAQGIFHDNDVQFNAVGIDVAHLYGAGSTVVSIYSNCLNNNGVSAMDVNAYLPPYQVLWYTGSGLGNFYSDNATSANPFPIGANMGYYAVMATNTPTPDNDDLALGETMVVDFVYDATTCDPFPALKAADFVISYDDALLDVVSIVKGDYLPEPVAFVYDNSTAGSISIDIGSGDSEAQTSSGTLVTVTFEAKADAVGSGSITVASSYKDLNNNPIPTMSPAMAFSVSDQLPPEFVSTGLSGSPTFDDVYSDAFDMTLDFELADDYCLLGLYYKIDGAGSWVNIASPGGAGVLSFTGSHVFDISALGLGTGDHTLNLLLYDCNGYGGHTTLDLAFSVDNTGPATPAFDLASQECAEDGWTHVVGVTIDVTTDYSADPNDMGQVQWAYASDFRLIQAYVASFDVDLDNVTYPGDIVHTLYVQVTDVYGNKSGWGSNSIEYNTSAPDNSLYSFDVPTLTSNTTVNGKVENWGNYGATMYAYSINDGGAALTCDGADWQACYWPIGNSYPFPVDLGASAPDGPYEVFFAVRDDAGNVSAIESDIVTLDKTQPVIESFVIMDADNDPAADCAFSVTWNVDYLLGVTGDPNRFKMGDATGAGSYVLLGAPDYVDAGISYYEGTHLWTSGGSPGDLYTVFTTVKDNVGNVSDEADASITGMWGATSVGALTINGGDGWTNDLTANLALAGATSNITHVRMGVSNSSAAMDLSAVAWIDFDPGTHTADMTGTTECGWTYVHIEGKNCSDVVSAQVWDRIKVDTEAPVIDLVEIRNGDAKTRFLTNPVDLTLTETCGVWKIMISEDDTFGDPAKGNTVYQTYTGTETHTFAVGDGTRTVHVRVMDRAGNEANGSASIILDREKPTGVLEIVGDPAC
ncbi:MAG: cohesin domain-containing protein, partial [Candidatus Zixiibacteriota bacterium]